MDIEKQFDLIAEKYDRDRRKFIPCFEDFLIRLCGRGDRDPGRVRSSISLADWMCPAESRPSSW